MDAETGLGLGASSELREQIQQTQSDLGSKIGALEGEFRNVVIQAKERVRESVNAVQEVVDVRRYVGRRPILASAIALGAGILVGARRPRMERHRRMGRMVSVRGPRGGRLWSTISPEIATLRALMVGRALGFVGEMVRDRIRGGYHPEGRQSEAGSSAPIQ
ncbi:MAG: hypothetical protein RIS36_188 [Pseudomonadota bacterium]|jgi:ElaB/YqjD/DUF883 family membrane-anchored ribosome-binding protein